MTQQNIDTLERIKHHWVTVKYSQTITGLNHMEKEDLTRVAREEFYGAGYSPDWNCGTCAFEAIKSIYTQYEKYLSNGTNTV